MNEEKNIWLTPQGIKYGPDRLESFFNITFNKINVRFSALTEMKQIHMQMSREELKLLRKAINREIPVDEQ